MPGGKKCPFYVMPRYDQSLRKLMENVIASKKSRGEKSRKKKKISGIVSKNKKNERGLLKTLKFNPEFYT